MYLETKHCRDIYRIATLIRYLFARRNPDLDYPTRNGITSPRKVYAQFRNGEPGESSVDEGVVY